MEEEENLQTINPENKISDKQKNKQANYQWEAVAPAGNTSAATKSSAKPNKCCFKKVNKVVWQLIRELAGQIF